MNVKFLLKNDNMPHYDTNYAFNNNKESCIFTYKMHVSRYEGEDMM